MVFDKIKPMLSAWKAMYFSPKKAIAAECKKKAGIIDGSVHIAAGTTAMFAVITIIVLLILLLSLVAGGKFDMAGAAIIGIFLLVMLVYYIVGLISNVVSTFMMNGFYYIVAAVLKGKGTFDRQFYLISVESAASMVLMLPAIALALILAIVFGIAGQGVLAFIGLLLPILVFMLYDAYLKIKVLQAVHGFSFWKAFAAWGVPVLIFVIFMALYIGLLVFAGGFAGRSAGRFG
jgi:hypothetical protein